MANPAGESNGEALKLDFDRRLALRSAARRADRRRVRAVTRQGTVEPSGREGAGRQNFQIDRKFQNMAT